MKVTGNLTAHFSLEEIACKDASRTLEITPELVDHYQRLEEFRIWYNRPMPINSGYRTEAHNKAVGGEKDSQHTKGVATDIGLPNEFPKWEKQRKDEFWKNVETKWMELCRRDRVQGGFGKYDTFMHLDSRKGTGKMATWDNRR